MDNYSYIQLYSKLEGYFNKTLEEMPVELRSEAVRLCAHVEHLWDSLSEAMRRSLVETHDAQHDPTRQEEQTKHFNLGFFSAVARNVGHVADWGYWASQRWLTPREIACLAFELDPKYFDDIHASNKRLFQEGALADEVDKIERSAIRDTEGQKLSPQEWVEWAQGKGYAVPKKFIKAVAEGGQSAPGTKVGTLSAKAQKRIPVQEQQENAILNWLKEKNYDPQNLPAPPQGKPGVKKECREELHRDCPTLFLSVNVFNTAWERLRANKEIVDAK